MLSNCALSTLSREKVRSLVRIIFGDVINAQDKGEAKKLAGSGSETLEERNREKVVHSGPRNDLIDTLKSSSGSPTSIHKDRSFGRSHGLCAKCCPCLMTQEDGRTASEEFAILELAKAHCRNREEFMKLMGVTTKNAKTSLAVMKNVRKLLQLEMEPMTEAKCLSTIGGSMWLLTFAIQHLIDPKHEYKGLMPHIFMIRATFQDIGQLSQVFAANTEVLFTKLDLFRENCIAIVETMREVYKIKEDPFEIRPIMIQFKSFVENRVQMNGSRRDPDDKDATFHVQWTPLKVMFKDIEEDGKSHWEGFADLHLEDKVKIFKSFFETILHFLKNAMVLFDIAADYTYKLDPLTHDKKLRNCSLAEVTGAMVDFLKSERGHAPELSPADLQTCSTSLQEMWSSVDTLFEVTVEASLLIQESRDIIRVCYMYAKHFYKWKMADFNQFDPESHSIFNKKKLEKTRRALARMMGHRRYSDAEMFLALADFTSSNYQEVAKYHDVESNGMFMKLDEQSEEADETWGMVGELDELLNPAIGSKENMSKNQKRTLVNVGDLVTHGDASTQAPPRRKSSDDEDSQPASAVKSDSSNGSE